MYELREFLFLSRKRYDCALGLTQIFCSFPRFTCIYARSSMEPLVLMEALLAFYIANVDVFEADTFEIRQ